MHYTALNSPLTISTKFSDKIVGNESALIYPWRDLSPCGIVRHQAEKASENKPTKYTKSAPSQATKPRGALPKKSKTILMITEKLPKTDTSALAGIEDHQDLNHNLHDVYEVLDLIDKVEFPDILTPSEADSQAGELSRLVHGDFYLRDIRQLERTTEACSHLFEDSIPLFEEFMNLIADSMFEEVEEERIRFYFNTDPAFEQAVKIHRIPAENPTERHMLLNGCFAYHIFLFRWFMTEEPERMAKWARLYVYLVA